MITQNFYGQTTYGTGKYFAGYPKPLDLSVTLNGVAITDKLTADNYAITIENVLTKQVDNASFTIVDRGSLFIEDWQEIIVWDGATKLFSGVVLIADEKLAAGGTRIDVPVRATDYTTLLDHVVIKRQYLTPYYDSELIQMVFGDYLPEIDVASFVNPIQVYPKIQFNRCTLRQMMDTLATSSSADWYIDENKCLHFFEVSTETAPFELSDAPDLSTSFPYTNFVVNKDGTGVINRIEVVGGTTLSPDFTFYQSQSAVSKLLNIPYKLSPPSSSSSIIVYRQDGGAGTNLIQNPSFEVNITDFWTQGTTGHGIAYTWLANTELYSGTHCLDILASADPNYYGNVYNQSITLTSGEWLSFSAFCKSGVIGAARIAVYDATNGLYLGIYDCLTALAWERMVLNVQNTTSGTITVRLILQNNSTDGATHTYFDCVQAEKTSWATDYIDGSRGTGYAWTSTANNSTSTRTNLSIWTQLTVKTGYVDQLHNYNDVAFYYNEAKLELLHNWPVLATSARITGRNTSPTRVKTTDEVSRAYYGRYFDSVINDPSIVDRDVAVIKARGVLAQNALGSTALKCQVRQAGLRAGMAVKVTNAKYGYSQQLFTVQRVTTKITTAGYAYYDLELGLYRPQFVDLWLKIARMARTVPEWTEGEVLDEILSQGETLTMHQNSTSVSASHTPYVWNTPNWDFAVFG